MQHYSFMEGLTMTDTAPAKKAAATKRTAAAKRTASKTTEASTPSGVTHQSKKSASVLEVKGDVSAPSDEGTTGDPNAIAAANPNPQNLDFIHNPDNKVASKIEDRGFVFEHNLDPARAIPGTSDYLDHRERRNAEIQRARVEGREPDLENPPASQGTPLSSTAKIEAQIPYNVTVEPDVILGVSVTDGDVTDKDDE